MGLTLDAAALLDGEGDAEEGRVLLHLLRRLFSRGDESVDGVGLVEGGGDARLHDAVEHGVDLGETPRVRLHHCPALHLRKTHNVRTSREKCNQIRAFLSKKSI
jgi:hypothetical protein